MMRTNNFNVALAACGCVVALGLASWLGCGGSGWSASSEIELPDKITFSEHVAPIVYRHCADCHRPGESAPFGLLTHREVKQHAEQIVEVITSRFMPPWLPEAGYGEFAHERRLSDREREMIRRWVEAGAPEGDPANTPEPPQWAEGWQLGEPDLVVTMPEAYTLPPEGTDAFRNFVIPVPVENTRYVKAVELRPGNNKIVHHAVIHIDDKGFVRKLDAKDAEPGFDGMDMGRSHPPDGHFLGWTPGKVPNEGGDEMAWRLEPGTDLVLQLHMLPSGKPEKIQPRIGLFFADEPPSQHSVVVELRNDNIDLAPGVTDYVVEDLFELPVDVDVVGIYPHAHYLGKIMEAFAILPDGTKQWLIYVKDWDFNWQDDYRYSKPVHLPKGSTIHMRYTFDNSAENVRNPNQPPKRVTIGNQSSDEMATMMIQVMLGNMEQRELLREAKYRKDLNRNPEDWDAYNNLATTYWNRGILVLAVAALDRAVKLNPDFVEAHINLGKVLCIKEDYERSLTHLEQALRVQPDFAEAHRMLGVVYLEQGKLDDAARSFQRVLELKPDWAQVHYHLGEVAQRQKKLEEAIGHLERAIDVDADHAPSHFLMAVLRNRQKKFAEAVAHIDELLRIDAESVEAHYLLAQTHQKQEHFEEAAAAYERVLELKPEHAGACHRLGFLRQREGKLDEAVKHYRKVLQIAPQNIAVANSLAWILATSSEPELRDGKQALQWARQCAEATNHQQPGVLATLAAACAEVGQFDEAVQWQTKAIELAPAAARDDLQRVLALYRDGKSFREMGDEKG